ncbi:MAG TPA: hypothetical protein VMT61_03340 [Candidatus Binataceae bacterium]|nr:hypothetical protein [Candidatus Binataceae bacterium]
MAWYVLTRLTSEAGNSDVRTATIMLNSDAVQLFQRAATSTKIYMRSGALDQIDVLESIEEILEQSEVVEGHHGNGDGGAAGSGNGRMASEGDGQSVIALPGPEDSD